MQQMQMQLQIEAQKKLQEGQIEEQLARLKAALEERQSIGQQRRDLEIQRVLKMMDQGQPVQPTDFSDLSIMLKEELRKLEQQQVQQNQQEQQKELERQILLEELSREQMASQQPPAVPSNSRGNRGLATEQDMAAYRGMDQNQEQSRAGEVVESG
jgi:hypothetical protein